MLKRFFYIVVLWLLGIQFVFSQLYPVQVVPQLIPPYSTKLSEYATTSQDKLIVQLLLSDLNESSRQVRLKMYIEGNGISVRSTDYIVGANPIYLDGGIPLRLSNVDLRPYFELQNLQGLSPEQYNKPLKDGLYKICFEAYDYITGQRLSQKSCSIAYMVLNDPPILNMPIRGENIAVKDPQNILFNWTPRHVNATNVQYEFTLVEVWDKQISPEQAFLSSPPIWQETTRSNTFLYDISKTALTPGKTYAWRVRALVSDGISETSVFKNDGYSEIYYFTCNDNCKAPEFALAEMKTPKSVIITWQASEHTSYQVQYRKKGASQWFNVESRSEKVMVQNLEANTEYEWRVGGDCGSGAFTFGNINTLKTPTEEDSKSYQCGLTPDLKIANQEPLSTLGINQSFTAGDFPVTVTEVQGSNGNFSGKGYIVVPYLADTKIAVQFSGISVNTEFQMYNGVIETVYDPTWKNVITTQEIAQTAEDIWEGLGDLKNLIFGGLKEKTEEAIKNRDTWTEAEWNDYYNDISENKEDAIQLIKELKETGVLKETELEEIEELLNSAEEKIIQGGSQCKPSISYTSKPVSGANSNNEENLTIYTNSEDCDNIMRSGVAQGEQAEQQLFNYFNLLSSLLNDNDIKVFYYKTKCTDERKVYYFGGWDGSIYVSATPTDYAIEKNIGITKESPSYLAYKKGDKWIIYNKINQMQDCTNRIFMGSGGMLATHDEYKHIYNEFLRAGVKEKKYTLFIQKKIEKGQGKTGKEKEVENNLKTLKKNCRSNQDIELAGWDSKTNKLKYYHLNTKGELEEIKHPLTDEQIQNGEWKGGNEVKIRYTTIKGGIVQIQSIGFRNDLEIAKGKTADLKGLAAQIKIQTNKYLSENTVNNFELKAPNEVSDEFADGGKFKIGENSTYIRIISEGMDIVKEFLKKSEIKEEVYTKSDDKFIIKAPGIITGTIEGSSTLVTDITNLGYTIYDFSINKQSREEAKAGFLQVKEAIGNDTSQFVPIIVQVLSGNSEEQWAAVFDEKEDIGKRSNFGTRGTIITIKSVASGTAFIKNLPEIAENIVTKIKKTKNIVDDTNEAITDIKKAIKTFVENPFDELGKLKSNIRYKQGEFDYFGETDELGRLESMEAPDLKLTEREKRLIHDRATPGKEAGDHAGHLIADRFGGSKEIDNLISQLSSVNLSDYKKIENLWANALFEGKKVEVNIKVIYEGVEIRPSAFEIKYKIDGESLPIKKISNIK